MVRILLPQPMLWFNRSGHRDTRGKMRRGGVNRCQPNGRCRRSSASEKRCPGERTTATVSVPPPGMWACLPLCGGRGNGHWRTQAKTPFPATVVCARRRQNGLVCGTNTRGGGGNARSCSRPPLFSPPRRVEGGGYRGGAHDLAGLMGV